MIAKRRAIVHCAIQAANILPDGITFIIKIGVAAAVDKEIPQQLGRIAKGTAHILAIEYENAAIQYLLRHSHQPTLCAGEVWIGL